MLEHIGSGVEDLYKDLTIANVSAWQQYTLAFTGTEDKGGALYVVMGTTPVIGSRTVDLRQYFRYVRAGARRVAATSDQGAIRPVAFTNVGGAPVLVLHATIGGTIVIKGLRPGTYGVSSSKSAVDLGTTAAGQDGEIRVLLPVPAIYTVYARP